MRAWSASVKLGSRNMVATSGEGVFPGQERRRGWEQAMRSDNKTNRDGMMSASCDPATWHA
ncbi:hypothetical protein ASC80_00730 [Afipia sp. Root123D2]|nr:hypothetical protein ASC80_00730 [Afipia sp. Root123D2]